MIRDNFWKESFFGVLEGEESIMASRHSSKFCHSGRNKKLSAYFFKAKNEGERLNWKWWEAVLFRVFCEEIPWSKRKLGVEGLQFPIIFHTRSHDRNPHTAGSKRLKLKQRPWGKAAYWFSLHNVLSVLSYSTQDHQFRNIAPYTMNWALPTPITV